jgi:hypothetical protein
MSKQGMTYAEMSKKGMLNEEPKKIRNREQINEDRIKNGVTKKRITMERSNEE